METVLCRGVPYLLLCQYTENGPPPLVISANSIWAEKYEKGNDKKKGEIGKKGKKKKEKGKIEDIRIK
jgi:hypothetical protein